MNIRLVLLACFQSVISLCDGTTAISGQFPHFVSFYEKLVESENKIKDNTSDNKTTKSIYQEANTHFIESTSSPEPCLSKLVFDEAALEECSNKTDFDENPDNQFTVFCGGSMISLNIIVTAAQCLNYRSKQNIKVIAGSIFSSFSKAKTDGQINDIEELIIHPDYHKESDIIHYNDIALALVKKSFTYNYFVRPIPFTMSVMKKIPTEGKIGSMGCVKKQSFSCNEHHLSETLKYKEMKRIPDYECVKKMSHVSSTFKKVPDTLFCVEGKSTKGTGFSDFGSSFTVEINGINYLDGIHSGTGLCNLECIPTLVTDIKSQITFISKSMAQLKLKSIRDFLY